MTAYELADFHPTTGHLHTCAPSYCDSDCASHLYAIAQDAEQRIAAIRAEAERAQDGRGSWVHATRILAVTAHDPEDRP